MQTVFEKEFQYVLKHIPKDLLDKGYSMFIKVWQDNTLELEIRISSDGRIHRFMYDKNTNYTALFHRIIDKAKIDVGFENFGVHPMEIIETMLDYKEL